MSPGGMETIGDPPCQATSGYFSSILEKHKDTNDEKEMGI